MRQMGKKPNNTKTVCLILPVPPSVNEMFMGSVHKRFLLSKKYRAYRDQVSQLIRSKKLDRFVGDVDVDITWYRKQKMGDVDGRLKPTLDVLTHGGLWEDDRFVKSLKIERNDNEKDHPRIEIVITGEVQ